MADAQPGDSRPIPRLVRATRRFALADPLFRGLTTLFAFGLIAILILIGYEMGISALPSIEKFGLGFLTSGDWNPVMEEFGALPFIFGTLVSSLLAIILATPIAVGVAIFLAELAPPWLRNPVSFLIELLAAIPSVVYGLWALFVLVPLLRTAVQPALQSTLGFLPFFQGPPIGLGLMAAGVILAIMILPTITAVAREVLMAVPEAQREAALALGATRWEMIWRGVLPSARSGVLGGIILGLGRALGETMAVTMVIGNRPQIAASIFAPAYSMSAVIANEFAEATSDIHLSSLIQIGLLLFVVTFLLNVLARLLVRPKAKGAAGRWG